MIPFEKSGRSPSSQYLTETGSLGEKYDEYSSICFHMQGSTFRKRDFKWMLLAVTSIAAIKLHRTTRKRSMYAVWNMLKYRLLLICQRETKPIVIIVCAKLRVGFQRIAYCWLMSCLWLFHEIYWDSNNIYLLFSYTVSCIIQGCIVNISTTVITMTKFLVPKNFPI